MDDEKTIWAEGLPETAEDKQRCAWTLADLPTGKEEWKYENQRTGYSKHKI